jgi:hypothetical protein
MKQNKAEEPSTPDDAFFKRVTGLVLNELAEAFRIRGIEPQRSWHDPAEAMEAIESEC